MPQGPSPTTRYPITGADRVAFLKEIQGLAGPGGPER